MVNRRASLLCAVWLVTPLAAGRAEVPAYKLGDVATQEVVTPVALTVINPEATELLREKEARKIPPVLRFRAQAADEAETALRTAFTTARTHFAATLKRTRGGRPESERAVSDPHLQRAIQSARREGERFPLLKELAPVWAREESDAAIQMLLVLKLRAVMSQPIIAGKAPPTFTPRNALNLVPVQELDQQPTPEEVARLGRIVKGAQFSPLAAARSQLLKSFPENEQERAKFVAKFITTNALPDVELTQLLRTRHTEALAATDHYQPAEVVVKPGQIIDPKALAALGALREKSLIGTLQTQLVQEQSAGEQSRQRIRWLTGGLAALAGLTALNLWRIRARRRQIGLPALVTVNDRPAEAAWRERAVAAEARVELARHALRSGFMHWMRERIVQGLFHQRAELLSAQQNAAAEMHALEQRLERLQTPLQERIVAYEKRIVELENDLAVKGAENRELIKAKITLAKHQLSVERERRPSHFGTN